MSAQSSAKPVTEGGRHRGRSQEVGDRRLMVMRTRTARTRTVRTRTRRRKVENGFKQIEDPPRGVVRGLNGLGR